MYVFMVHVMHVYMYWTCVFGGVCMCMGLMYDCVFLVVHVMYVCVYHTCMVHVFTGHVYLVVYVFVYYECMVHVVHVYMYMLCTYVIVNVKL